MVELVDAIDSKSVACEGVLVQVRPGVVHTNKNTGISVMSNEKAVNSLSLQIFPAEILTKKLRVIEQFDVKLQQYFEQMIDVMKSNDGLGIAANQIGLDIRAVAVDLTFSTDEDSSNSNSAFLSYTEKPLMLVNPEIKWVSKECIKDLEGCLSFPGIIVRVKRYECIVVSYYDCAGISHEIKAKGLLARCLQHEIDHLDGMSFIDRINPVHKSMIIKKLLKRQKFL